MDTINILVDLQEKCLLTEKNLIEHYHYSENDLRIYTVRQIEGLTYNLIAQTNLVENLERRSPADQNLLYSILGVQQGPQFVDYAKPTKNAIHLTSILSQYVLSYFFFEYLIQVVAEKLGYKGKKQISLVLKFLKEKNIINNYSCLRLMGLTRNTFHNNYTHIHEDETIKFKFNSSIEKIEFKKGEKINPKLLTVDYTAKVVSKALDELLIIIENEKVKNLKM